MRLCLICVQLDITAIAILNVLKYVVIQVPHQFYPCLQVVVVYMDSTICFVDFDFFIEVLFYYGPVQPLEVFEVLTDEHDLILLVKELTYLTFIVWDLYNGLIELLF